MRKENNKKETKMSSLTSSSRELKSHEIPSKTVTPYYTLDWYIKWVSSIVLIVGMMLTANNIFPINLYFHIVGLVGWFVVSMMWNDRALIIINAIGLSIFVNGLLRYYTSGVAG